MNHLVAEVTRLRVDVEVWPSRQEAGQTQQPHRVLSKGWTHMSKRMRAQIVQAAGGVVQHTLFINGHRIDRQISSGEILLQRDLWPRVECESVVAHPRLALSSGKRELGMGLGMQEDREVLSDGTKSG